MVSNIVHFRFNPGPSACPGASQAGLDDDFRIET
jgi:hypothetical protein